MQLFNLQKPALQLWADPECLSCATALLIEAASATVQLLSMQLIPPCRFRQTLRVSLALLPCSWKHAA